MGSQIYFSIGFQCGSSSSALWFELVAAAAIGFPEKSLLEPSALLFHELGQLCCSLRGRLLSCLGLSPPLLWIASFVFWVLLCLVGWFHTIFEGLGVGYCFPGQDSQVNLEKGHHKVKYLEPCMSENVFIPPHHTYLEAGLDIGMQNDSFFTRCWSRNVHCPVRCMCHPCAISQQLDLWGFPLRSSWSNISGELIFVDTLAEDLLGRCFYSGDS